MWEVYWIRRESQGWFGIKRGNVEDQNAIGWNLSVHLLRSSAKDPPAFRTPLPVSFLRWSISITLDDDTLVMIVEPTVSV